ncbi:MAG: chorismate mutase [Paenibacillaceae bacterium]|jgi:chorismate mutase|nr:chorismate mutase [Paenibacillaceae bacterium]
MTTRGIRGATTVTHNNTEEILEATLDLLLEIVRANELTPEHVTCLWITVTDDINATFPARAVRDIPGWEHVAVLCAQEIPVPGALPMCVRLMLLVNTDRSLQQIVHVYARGATVLRPERARA